MTKKILDALHAAMTGSCGDNRPWPYLDRLVPVQGRSEDGHMGRSGAAACGTVVTVYAASCDGLRRLAAPGAWSIAKLGVTAGHLQQRLHWMGQDAYAALYRTADGRVGCEQGFTEWLAQHMPVTGPFDPDGPVSPVGRGLRVRLPASLSVRVFDRALSAALKPIAVDHLMATPGGLARCAAFGLDPARYQRLTSYDFAGRPRVSRAREVVFFRPRLDTDALVRVIEAVVAAHLAGLADILQRAA